MLERRLLLGLAVGAAAAPAIARAQSQPPAVERMNQLGAENQALVARTGMWDVTETNWTAPGAEPVVSTGLVAERKMIGSILQEIIRSAPGTERASINRLDYLTFNRVEGRWDYVSMDARVPVGIMPAWSFDRGEPGDIVVQFAPFAVAGPGQDVAGQLLRMDQVITWQGPDRESKDQHFIMADGRGTTWLAHRYAYARRS